MNMSDYPIDIVVPWVDGDDPAWRAQRAMYRPEHGSDNNEARFREWDLFRYWFRGVEQYAPWVRTVHLITWGHLPPWLDTNHPKLHIVNHKDYIPEQYLPTFSSHPIENNVHRIPGLAEHFILFNDDVYLTQPTKPEDFFRGGVPVDTAVLGGVTISDSVSFMPYIALNNLALINERFSKREVLRRDFKKWFHPKYGKLALYNLYYLPGRNFPGVRSFHTCLAYRKSTLQQVWDACGEAMDRTCKNRFRSREDVSQYLFRYWRLAKGEFVPAKPNSVYLTIGEDDASVMEAALANPRYKVVCINDDPTSLSFEQEQKKLHAIFEKAYPTSCAFEKDADRKGDVQ
ncbi:MAG: Stealth CR1 domain-containing protein [Clostridia bacterium]|nr:Stealth CR1 domain-containing protein [Clostridia bacterium]